MRAKEPDFTGMTDIQIARAVARYLKADGILFQYIDIDGGHGFYYYRNPIGRAWCRLFLRIIKWYNRRSIDEREAKLKRRRQLT